MTVAVEPKNVTEALARIMAELPAISKKRHPGDTVTYAYRGIEEITAEAQELCAKYGVVYYPKAEITEIKDITVNGKPWTDTIALVEYEIVHGPSDTSRFVRVPAIGRDNSDKGSNKAMTQAFKYALIQTLMIADPKDDGDRERHETESRSTPRPAAPRAERPAPVADAETGEIADPNLASQKQLNMIGALFAKKGFPDDKEIRHAYIEAVVNHPYRSSKELSKKDASAAIEALMAEEEAS